jgi:hypothetical protein
MQALRGPGLALVQRTVPQLAEGAVFDPGRRQGGSDGGADGQAQRSDDQRFLFERVHERTLQLLSGVGRLAAEVLRAVLGLARRVHDLVLKAGRRLARVGRQARRLLLESGRRLACLTRQAYSPLPDAHIGGVSRRAWDRLGIALRHGAGSHGFASLRGILAHHQPGEARTDHGQRHGVLLHLPAEVAEHVLGPGSLEGMGQLVDELARAHFALQGLYGVVQRSAGHFHLAFDLFGGPRHFTCSLARVMSLST